jgi:DNA-binding SARP family transcriptional activator
LSLPTKKALAIVAYLALCGSTPRSKLAGLFWEKGEDEARRNLRQELHRLQNSPLSDWLELTQDSVTLRTGFSCDVLDFRQAIKENKISEALTLYRGVLHNMGSSPRQNFSITLFTMKSICGVHYWML